MVQKEPISGDSGDLGADPIGPALVRVHSEPLGYRDRGSVAREPRVSEKLQPVSMLLTRQQSHLFVRGECAEMSDLAAAPVTCWTLRIHTAHPYCARLAAPLACAVCAVCAVCAPCVVAPMRSRLNHGVRAESQTRPKSVANGLGSQRRPTNPTPSRKRVAPNLATKTCQGLFFHVAGET
jgi:hypothetical protein